MSEDQKKHRYPGTRPFEQKDSSEFFGRENDITGFSRIITQDKCAVLFGKSGLGKTSLVRAGILPRFEKQVGKEYPNGEKKVFSYIIRLGIKQENDEEKLVEKIEKVVWKQDSLDFLQTNPFLPASAASRLWHHFKNQQISLKQKNTDAVFVIVLDQFEELFTYTDEELYAFKIILAELLSDYAPANIRNYLGEKELDEQTSIPKEIFSQGQTGLPVKVIISIRSDKYNLLNRLKDALPNIYRNVYELRPLSAIQARNAIERPAQLAGNYHTDMYTYESGVVDKILNFLIAKTSADREYSSEQDNIEPYCLQIICSYLEIEKIGSKKKRSISPEDVTNLNEIIELYYSDSIRRLNLDAAMQEKIFDILEEEMIYKKDKRRLIIYKSILMDKFGIDEILLQELTDTRLIRAENYSSGGISYEISHDALVDPILLARAKRKEGVSTVNVEVVDEALKQLNEEIIKRPNDYYAFKRRGDYYSYKNDYENAATDYMRVLELKPNDIDTYNSLGIIFYNSGQFDKALAYYDDALKLDDKFEYAYLNKGLIYQKLQNNELAIKNYTEAIRVKPDYVEAYNNLGLLYEDMEDYQKARENYEAAIKIDPDYLYPLLNMGNIYFREKDTEEAKKYYERVIDINPSYAPAHYNLGLYMMEHEKHDEAIACFKRALELNPVYPAAIQSLGFVYEKQGYPDKALEQYELVQTKSDILCQDFYRLGYSFYNSGDYDKAIRCFLGAIDISPQYADAINNLGLSYYQTNQLADALHYFNNLQQIDPAYEAVYNNLGLVYEKLNEREKAESNYLKAVSINPSFNTAIENLAYFYQKDKEYEKALHYFQEALKLRPDSYILHNDTGLIYFDLGDHENATLHMNEALRQNPGYSLALNNLGYFAEQREQYLEAILYYEQAMNSDSELSEAYGNLINSYEKAKTSAHPINDALNAQNYCSIGKAYYYRYNYTGAEECFIHATEKDGKYAAAYYYLGLVYNADKKPQKAIENFLTAHALEPVDFDTLVELGNLYVDQNKYGKAENYFNEAIKINPDEPSAFNGLGNVCYRRNNFSEALNYYKKALELDAGNEDTFGRKIFLNNLGATAYKLEKFDDAIEYNEQSIKLNPDYASPYDNLGTIFRDRREYKKAYEYFQKAISLDPDDANFFLDLGSLYRQVEQYEKAVEFIRRSIELNNILPEAWYNLGLVYFDKKEFVLAVKHFKKAIDLDKYFKQAYLKLGVVAELENNFDQAATYYADAERVASGDVYTKLHMAGLFIKTDKLEKAKDVLDEISALDMKHSGNLLSGFYEVCGDLEAKKGNVKEAVGHYSTAIENNPYNKSVLRKLSEFYMSQNNPEEAARYSSRLKEMENLKIVL